jgi:cysteine desulfurase/selenocysteine lyase
MIKRVQLGGFTMNDLPYKFEAGTPAIAEGIGFGEAVDYLANLGMEAVHQYEQALTAYALERLEEVPGIQVYGPEAEDKGGVLSFIYNDIHTHDVAHILDSFGIAVRPSLCSTGSPTFRHRCYLPRLFLYLQCERRS